MSGPAAETAKTGITGRMSSLGLRAWGFKVAISG
jgi:hypothetical protein